MEGSSNGQGERLSHAGIAVRVVVFFVMVWVMQIMAFFLFQPFGMLVAAALGVFAAGTVASVAVLRIYQYLPLSSLGLNAHSYTGLHSGIGFLLGAAGAAFAVGVPILAGKARIVASPEYPLSPWGILLVSLVLLFGAVGEELVFRGYPFQLLAGRYGVYQILLPFAVLFAAAHGANLNSSPLALFNTFAWGALLGYSLIRSGDLWLPSGIHFGWNFTLPLLGANVSGFTMGLTGYKLSWEGSDLWSGGLYGPEASAVTTVIVFALAYVLFRAPLHTQVLPLMTPGNLPGSARIEQIETMEQDTQ